MPIVDGESDLILRALDARDLLAVVSFDNVRCELLRTANQGFQQPLEASLTRRGGKIGMGYGLLPFCIALLHDRRQLFPTLPTNLRGRANCDDELLWEVPCERYHRR